MSFLSDFADASSETQAVFYGVFKLLFYLKSFFLTTVGFCGYNQSGFGVGKRTNILSGAASASSSADSEPTSTRTTSGLIGFGFLCF